MIVVKIMLGFLVAWFLFGCIIGAVLFYIKLFKPSFSIDKFMDELQEQ